MSHTHWVARQNKLEIPMSVCCLLWINKTRAKEKTCIWVSVRCKTKNQKWGIYMPHRHWVGRGTWTPKDKDEVNRQEVYECEGWVWDLDTIGYPSRLRLIRKSASLTRIFPNLDEYCLLWINKKRGKEKTYIWESVWYGTPKDKDEVNRREVCECEGWVWDFDTIGVPSRLRLIRKSAVLTRIFPTLDLSIEEKASWR
jgi:hypothetical protein